jgi:L-iditol 2-dehydrogenase
VIPETTPATIPQTMRAAVLYDVDDVRIEERPVPALALGDLLVKTAASGVCSGDLMPWYVRRKAPFVFGHEPAGTVVAAGTAADAPWVGARVFAHHHAPCMECPFCAREDYVQCARWRATALDPGGMAEYFRVPQANRVDTLRLDDGVSFVAGSLVEPLACVVKSLRRGTGAALDGRVPSTALAGRSVYVIGLGVMGLMHVALARALGATVIGSDYVPARRTLATALGAVAFAPEQAAAELAAAGGDGPDVVVCGPGSAGALEQSLDAVRRGGTVVMFTPLPDGSSFALDQNRAYFRDLRLVASYSCGPADTAAALAYIAAGAVTPEMLGVETAPFTAIGGAYEAMRAGRIVKAVALF